jgi:hypothetical protein
VCHGGVRRSGGGGRLICGVGEGVVVRDRVVVIWVEGVEPWQWRGGAGSTPPPGRRP